MKNITVFVGIIAVGLGLLLLLQRGRSQQRQKKTASSEDVYQGLRNLALQSTRTKLGLPPASKPAEPWGAIMDWGLAQGTATVVVFSDGHASVYLSSGGGFIGGAESHESIRNAAKKMVAVAAECQQHAQPTAVYPLPKRGEVSFYFLTDSGIFTATASEDELSGHRGPLATLGDAAQDLISQYRQVQ